MAERRMFSKKIIDSARFLKMPHESQVMYFHLIINADDDGVAEGFKVMRMLGISEDSLKILVAKGFVTVLNDDLVSHITNWTEHNKIRADRKVDSIYKDLLIKVVPEIELLEPKPRADRHGTSQWQPKDGIGKDRLGKDSIDKPQFKSSHFNDNETKSIIAYRKSIKATLKTQQGYTGLENKIKAVMDKYNIGLNKVLEIMADREWKSIEVDYVKNIKPIQAKKKAVLI